MGPCWPPRGGKPHEAEKPGSCWTFGRSWPIVFEDRTGAMLNRTQISSHEDPTASLREDLLVWWSEEAGDWDALVADKGQAQLPGGADLWNSMPEVDSKAVARSSPLFEKHLGVPLDLKLIRRGGYESIDAMIDDLVPKMEAAAA